MRIECVVYRCDLCETENSIKLRSGTEEAEPDGWLALTVVQSSTGDELRKHLCRYCRTEITRLEVVRK